MKQDMKHALGIWRLFMLFFLLVFSGTITLWVSGWSLFTGSVRLVIIGYFVLGGLSVPLWLWVERNTIDNKKRR